MSKAQPTQQIPFPDALKGKYNLTPGFGVGEFVFKGRSYHLDKMTVQDVDAIVAQGFDGVKAKNPPAEEKAPK